MSLTWWPTALGNGTQPAPLLEQHLHGYRYKGAPSTHGWVHEGCVMMHGARDHQPGGPGWAVGGGPLGKRSLHRSVAHASNQLRKLQRADAQSATPDGTHHAFSLHTLDLHAGKASMLAMSIQQHNWSRCFQQRHAGHANNTLLGLRLLSTSLLSAQKDVD